ncbi:MAG TPA: LysE family transporter [Verrucomicrobiae bacterium]|jgi:threonine/homoserine/homoserine lactone efflux protein|nr:LysE family transporter [Verrucomicrobiae bacterium]
MFDQHPLILAALTGIISGFILSVPVGPVNVTIINEGARSGLLWGMLIGAGATVMELIYCALAFTGFASFFDGRGMKAALELISFVFMLYLGVRFLKTSSIPAISRVEERFKSKLHPHSAFGIGFVRVMANPGVFLFWIVLAAHFHARDWVPASRKGVISCVAGVGVGVGLWFAGLSYAVSRGHRKFTQGTLLKMEHGSGIAMLLLALGEGIRIVVQMARHKF